MKVGRQHLRNRLFSTQVQRLAHLAYQAIRRGHTPDDIMVVCIEVDDPTWTPLVQHLMPDYDWEAIRKTGQEPIARGIVTMSLRDYLSATVPTVAPAFDMPRKEGEVIVAVMAGGGASIYFMQPKLDAALN